MDMGTKGKIITITATIGTMILCISCDVGTVLMYIISAVVLFIGIGITSLMEEKEKKEQMQKTNWEKFYQECVKYGINGPEDLQKPDKRQRAERLLKSKGLPFQTVEEVFSPDHPEFQRIRHVEQQKKDEELKWQRSLYMSRAQGKLELAKLHGLDKPLYILHEELRSLNGTPAPSYIPMKKESDGMIMAGIASGIGGAVPALASLNSTAQHNEAIRAQNRAAQSINNAIFQAEGKAYGAKKHINQSIENYSKKLTEDISPQLLFSKLKIETESVTVKECGAIEIRANVYASQDIQIFSKYPAVIDGWIKATVFDGSKVVGECPMPFPYKGARPETSKDKTVGITGILPSGCKPDVKYRVEYTPGDLWAMEK